MGKVIITVELEKAVKLMRDLKYYEILFNHNYILLNDRGELITSYGNIRAILSVLENQSNDL